MKKRWFAVMSILLLSVGMIAGCARSAKEAPTAENPLILKIGVSTADADPRNIAAKQFAEEIANSTGGVILATVSGGGVLGDDAALIDAVSLGSGKVDIVISDASNFANYEPRMGISALPFLFDDFDTAWAFMDGDIEARAEEGLSKHNIRVLAHYCNGFRCVTNSRGPVESPEDMKGMVIRTPQNMVIMSTMSALGANPQPLGFSELYAALRKGTYDGQENPIPVIYNNRLFEVQEYLSITNHIYSGMCFAISESTWQRLTPEQQEILRVAAESSAESDRQNNRQQTQSLISKLEEAGMQINYPDTAPFAEATASVLGENEAVYGDLITRLKEWQEQH